MTATRHRPHRLHRRPGGERGSVTVWLATASLVMIVLVGLAVDLSGQVHAQQHARSVAAQAARAGGQQLQAGAIRGDPIAADPARAVAAAQAFLAASDVSGTATVHGSTVVVHTTARYTTRFLGIIGLNAMTVTGSAESHMVPAIGGAKG